MPRSPSEREAEPHLVLGEIVRGDGAREIRMLVAAVNRHDWIEIIVGGEACLHPLVDLRIADIVGNFIGGIRAKHEKASERMLQRQVAVDGAE